MEAPLGRYRWLSVLLLVSLVLCSFGTSPSPATPNATTPSKKVAIYGDSIMFESAGAVETAASAKGWTARIWSFPGSAPCDWLATLDSDMTTLRPNVVVLETMGNDLTPCMTRVTHTRGSPAYFKKYRSDFATYFRDAVKVGATVVVLRPLPVLRSRFNDMLDRLTTIAKQEAAKFHGVSVSTLPRDSVSVSGVFVATKRCLRGETAAMGCDKITKRIAVRAPDHLHLCPSGYPTPYSFFLGCAVYSSGAKRYGTAVARTVAHPPKSIRP